MRLHLDRKLLLLMFAILYFSTPALAYNVFFEDDFDSYGYEDLEDNWDVTFYNNAPYTTTGWTYSVNGDTGTGIPNGDSKLTVSSVEGSLNSLVYLSQYMQTVVYDFHVRYETSWVGSNTFYSFYIGGIFSIAYEGTQTSPYGRLRIMVFDYDTDTETYIPETTYYNLSAEDLNGSAYFDIYKTDSELGIYINGNSTASFTATNYSNISLIQLGFGGPSGAIGPLSIDRIFIEGDDASPVVVPEPLSITLLAVSLLKLFRR